MLLEFTGSACGLQLYPHTKFYCVGHAAVGSITPFGDEVYVLSVGILIVLVVVVPLGYINLSNNIIVQEGNLK
jgi:hypothetical protein